MKLYCKEKDFELYEGTMQSVLDTFEENSIDSIVTDPPYELNFMGKGWDNSGVAFQKDTWERCFKVLKPGGYLLAFGGTRTYHRIACAIEDAGFEIRDCIMWLYGSGFPKSMDVAKSIESKLLTGSANKTEFHKLNGVQEDKHHYGFTTLNKEQGNRPKDYTYEGESTSYLKELVPTTEEAKKWYGYGTALKPAYEPIIVARKPIEGTVVDTCLKYGVGAININECRVDFVNDADEKEAKDKNQHEKFGTKPITDNIIYGDYSMCPPKNYNATGRFPANVITDGSDEVSEGFPQTGNGNGTPYCYAGKEYNNKSTSMFNGDKPQAPSNYNDEGSAMRFFYQAKASKKDRDEGLDSFEEKEGHAKGNGLDRICEFCGETQLSGKCQCETKSWVAKPKKNIHPTVKPVELMQYLVRLVSPKGATVLDCFMGSGSTGKAVMFENRERNANYKFIGIEMTSDYLPIAKSRILYGRDKYEYDLLQKKEIKAEEDDSQPKRHRLF